MNTHTLQSGDVFLIPLDAGRHALGQVIGLEETALNSVACAFWAGPAGQPRDTVGTSALCVQLVTSHFFDEGRWPVVGNEPVSIPPSDRLYEAFRNKNWVGVRIIMAIAIEKLLLAANGQFPWNGLTRPDYFDELLAPNASRPAAAFLESKDEESASD
jgi:hypothetical protein